MLSQYEVCKDIEAGIKRLAAGEMDKKTFDEFIKTSNAKLDRIKAEKERSVEFWQRYNATCYY